MANIKSQIKRIKTNDKRSLINKSYKSEIKTFYNKAKSAITNNSSDTLDTINQYYSVVDKAVKKGIIHQNKAANKKAKIMNKYNKINTK